MFVAYTKAEIYCKSIVYFNDSWIIIIASKCSQCIKTIGASIFFRVGDVAKSIDTVSPNDVTLHK